MSQDDWNVRLPAFEGPLDLLLFLIRRAEVDIQEIPIHQIAEQYLEYVRQISRVDIDLAGEFLVMAATLVEMKSRALAPITQREEDGEDSTHGASGLDPRRELIQQLLAYQKFRTLAGQLEARRKEWSQRSRVRVRPSADEAAAKSEDDLIEDILEDWELDELHLLDLVQSYERVSAAVDFARLEGHSVEYDDTPIALHQDDLIDQLTRAEGSQLSLSVVFQGRTQNERIGLFLAMLELMKQGRLSASQDDLNGPIALDLREVKDVQTPFADEHVKANAVPPSSKN